jgi:hypothetical protein
LKTSCFFCEQSKKAMGNRTSEENWAARERLTSIERWLWWRGHVGRPDLREFFGLSAAQASSDLQRYQELNPGAMVYQLNRKRYEVLEGMVPVMAKPDFHEAVRVFLGGGVVGAVGPMASSEWVAEVALPVRSVEVAVERAVVRCLLNGLRMPIVYRAVNASDAKSGKERWLRPTRLVWDGWRWHVRGWCELRERYADFVMSRVVKVGELAKAETALGEDDDWEHWETLKLQPNPSLGEDGMAALRYDFDLGRKKVLRLKVRKALVPYLRARMGVAGEGVEGFWVESVRR